MHDDSEVPLVGRKVPACVNERQRQQKRRKNEKWNECKKQNIVQKMIALMLKKKKRGKMWMAEKSV